MKNPLYESWPVIVVHVFAREGSDLAWCAPVPYRPALDTYRPEVPRAFCPACARAWRTPAARETAR